MIPFQFDGKALSDKAAAVIAEAMARRLTLATAESCTGGALAALLSNAPGAGENVHGGFLVYAKANKTAALGLPAALIRAHMAVSAHVAKAMAGRRSPPLSGRCHRLGHGRRRPRTGRGRQSGGAGLSGRRPA